MRVFISCHTDLPAQIYKWLDINYNRFLRLAKIGTMGLAKAAITCFLTTGLLPVNRILNTGKLLNPASALLLTVLLLFLSVAGASPALHQLIHADACSANHTCAITLFAKGQISSGTPPPVTVAFISRLVESRPVEKSVVHSVADVQLIPGRAPPCC